MEHFDDKRNHAAAMFFFMLFQIFMVLTVYAFAYSALVAVRMAIEKFALTTMVYLPEVIAVTVYAFVVFKTLKMFKTGKRLRAIAWMMAWASVIIVSIYVHLSQIIPT